MKPLLLHGSAKAASRKKLIEAKQKFDLPRFAGEAGQNNVFVFEEGSNLQTMLDTLSSTSLFADQQMIILENPPEDFTLSTLDSSHLTLIFWFDHEVTAKKPIMEWFKKNGQVLYFPESREVSVFPFLDHLAAKDNKAFLEMQKLKTAGFDIQYFITMVFYLLRNLTATPKTAPQFVKDKLTRQRRNFDLEKITNLYKDILEIDFKIKSGLLEKDQAEFLLVNKFIS